MSGVYEALDKLREEISVLVMDREIRDRKIASRDAEIAKLQKRLERATAPNLLPRTALIENALQQEIDKMRKLFTGEQNAVYQMLYDSNKKHSAKPKVEWLGELYDLCLRTMKVK